jgi:hypothetical protein
MRRRILTPICLPACAALVAFVGLALAGSPALAQDWLKDAQQGASDAWSATKKATVRAWDATAEGAGDAWT